MTRRTPEQIQRMYERSMSPQKQGFMSRHPLLSTFLVCVPIAAFLSLAVWYSDPPPAVGGTSVGSVAPAPAPEFLSEHYRKLSDGRTVLCLYREGQIGGYSSGHTPAIDCDWANAK